MTEYQTRTELEYTNASTGSNKKCEACDNFSHANSSCKLMSPNDAKVEKSGHCGEGFKPGKQLLWDYYLQEERRKRLINKT